LLIHVGSWPEYWTLFTFIPLHRMGDQTVCANHCMISRHASKVPSKMMLEKMRAKGWIWSDREPGGYQRATQTYLRSLWLITDRVRVHTQALFLCLLTAGKLLIQFLVTVQASSARYKLCTSLGSIDKISVC